VGERVIVVSIVRKDRPALANLFSDWAEVTWTHKCLTAIAAASGNLELNLLKLMDVHDSIIDANRLRYPERTVRLREIENSREQWPWYLWFARQLGYSANIERLAASEARRRLALAALAAERYRVATGNWPETLEALTPEYLDAVPEDPFDGQPLRYLREPTRLVIYSVGPDLADDGGEEALAPKGGGLPLDITFIIEKDAGQRE
jgi:hypothetical protein